MPLDKPDLLRHNNPNLALVDADSIRGGRRVVATMDALYALPPDLLKQDVTSVRVLATAKNYLLIDKSQADSADGWAEDRAGLDLAEVRAAINLTNGLTYNPTTGVGKLGGAFTGSTTLDMNGYDLSIVDYNSDYMFEQYSTGGYYSLKTFYQHQGNMSQIEMTPYHMVLFAAKGGIGPQVDLYANGDSSDAIYLRSYNNSLATAIEVWKSKILVNTQGLPFIVAGLPATTTGAAAGDLGLFVDSTGQLYRKAVTDSWQAAKTNYYTKTEADANYIKNQNTAAQATSNFWISGNGKGAVFTAGTNMSVDAADNPYYEFRKLGVLKGVIGLSTVTGGFNAGVAIHDMVFQGSGSATSAFHFTRATGTPLVTIGGTGSMLSVIGDIQVSNTIRTPDAVNIDTGSLTLKLSGGRSKGAASGGNIEFYTTPAGASGSTLNAEALRMTILPGGNVGIGTTTPTYLLDVNGSSRISTRLQIGANSDFTATSGLQLGNDFHLTINGPGAVNYRGWYNHHFQSRDGGTTFVSIASQATSNAPHSSTIVSYGFDSLFAFRVRSVDVATADLTDLYITNRGGLVLRKSTGDLGYENLVNGAMFYQSTANQFRGYRNGAWKNFLMEGDVVAPTAATFAGDFIQNQSAAAQAASFNISGVGTANKFQVGTLTNWVNNKGASFNVNNGFGLYSPNAANGTDAIYSYRSVQFEQRDTATIAVLINVVGDGNPVLQAYGDIATNNTVRGFNAAAGTDVAGTTLKIGGGRSRGAAAGGNIEFYTTPAGVSGTALNSEVKRHTIAADGTQTMDFGTNMSLVFSGGAGGAAGQTAITATSSDATWGGFSFMSKKTNNGGPYFRFVPSNGSNTAIKNSANNEKLWFLIGTNGDPEWITFGSKSNNFLLPTAFNGTASTSGIFAASGGISRGFYANATHQATANNDTLVGVDINPAFSLGTQIATFGAITGGSGYTSGTYNGVALTATTGTGTGATANITVTGGVVTAVTLVNGGTGFAVNDTLTCNAIGAGTGFSIPVATIGYTGVKQYGLRVQNSDVQITKLAGTITRLLGVDSTGVITTAGLAQNGVNTTNGPIELGGTLIRATTIGSGTQSGWKSFEILNQSLNDYREVRFRNSSFGSFQIVGTASASMWGLQIGDFNQDTAASNGSAGNRLSGIQHRVYNGFATTGFDTYIRASEGLPFNSKAITGLKAVLENANDQAAYIPAIYAVYTKATNLAGAIGTPYAIYSDGGLNYFKDNVLNDSTFIHANTGAYNLRGASSVTGFASAGTTGGTLEAATYYAKIAAYDFDGNVIVSSEISRAIDGTTTNAINWTWTAVTGAAYYRVYVGTATGAQDRFFTAYVNSYKQTAYGVGDGSGTSIIPVNGNFNLIRMDKNSTTFGGAVTFGGYTTGSSPNYNFVGTQFVVSPVINNTYAAGTAYYSVGMLYNPRVVSSINTHFALLAISGLIGSKGWDNSPLTGGLSNKMILKFDQDSSSPFLLTRTYYNQPYALAAFRFHDNLSTTANDAEALNTDGLVVIDGNGSKSESNATRPNMTSLRVHASNWITNSSNGAFNSTGTYITAAQNMSGSSYSANYVVSSTAIALKVKATNADRGVGYWSNSATAYAIYGEAGSLYFTDTYTDNIGTIGYKMLELRPTYNQTTGATGHVYGTYYKPTVTSVIGTHYAQWMDSGVNYFGGEVHANATIRGLNGVVNGTTDVTGATLKLAGGRGVGAGAGGNIEFYTTAAGVASSGTLNSETLRFKIDTAAISALLPIGFNSVTTDPSTTTSGLVWYNSTDQRLKGVFNGIIRKLLTDADVALPQYNIAFGSAANTISSSGSFYAQISSSNAIVTINSPAAGGASRLILNRVNGNGMSVVGFSNGATSAANQQWVMGLMDTNTTTPDFTIAQFDGNQTYSNKFIFKANGTLYATSLDAADSVTYMMTVRNGVFGKQAVPSGGSATVSVGSGNTGIRIVSASTTATLSDDVLIFEGTTAGQVITLPTGNASWDNKVLRVNNTSNSVTLSFDQPVWVNSLYSTSNMTTTTSHLLVYKHAEGKWYRLSVSPTQ